ncbi:hypothetical protein R1flu_011501 [Riccia fluitans]|uniref:Uncharacterized protein n=1 Tax=Riccia fluitans TaxID=41844 RepID=A0ABD1Z953_9MARC
MDEAKYQVLSLNDSDASESSTAPAGTLLRNTTICYAKYNDRSGGLMPTVSDECGCLGLQSKPPKRIEGSGPSDRPRSQLCILSFETLELISSWQQLEPLLLARNWTPGFLSAGWLEYHYHGVVMGNVVFKRIRVPKRMEDARKLDLLKLVRTVNRTAEENVLCVWVRKEPPTLTRLQRCLSMVKGYQSCSSWKACATSAQLPLERPLPEPSENPAPALLALEAVVPEASQKPTSSSSLAPVLALEAPVPQTSEKYSSFSSPAVNRPSGAEENVLCAWVQREPVPPPLSRLQRCLSLVDGYQSCSSSEAYATVQLALEGPAPESSKKSSSSSPAQVLPALEAPVPESSQKPNSSSNRARVLALEVPKPELSEKPSSYGSPPVAALEGPVPESAEKCSSSSSAPTVALKAQVPESSEKSSPSNRAPVLGIEAPVRESSRAQKKAVNHRERVPSGQMQRGEGKHYGAGTRRNQVAAEREERKSAVQAHFYREGANSTKITGRDLEASAAIAMASCKWSRVTLNNDGGFISTPVYCKYEFKGVYDYLLSLAAED